MYINELTQETKSYAELRKLITKGRSNISVPRNGTAVIDGVWSIVHYGEVPTDIAEEYEVKESAPVKTNGRYEINYSLVSKPQEELDAMAADKLEEAKRTLTRAVEAMLDESSRSRKYFSILSECSYIGSPTFGPEAQVTSNWRDAVWLKVYEIEDDVVNGVVPIPTVDELLAELPVRELF